MEIFYICPIQYSSQYMQLMSIWNVASWIKEVNI